MLGYHPPREQTPPRPAPPQSRHPPGPGTPRNRHPPQSRHPRTRHPLSRHNPLTRHPLGADIPPPPWDQAPPTRADGYCCGRYASYWNAFLLCIYVSCAYGSTKKQNQEYRIYHWLVKLGSAWKWLKPCYRPQRSCEGYVFTGVSLSTEGECMVPGGLVSQHALRQTPPPRERWLLLRMVRILLECILVYM